MKHKFTHCFICPSQISCQREVSNENCSKNHRIPHKLEKLVNVMRIKV